MPKRPVQHQLESWSRAKFDTAIPSEWVTRQTPGPDYGIDCRVEIFHEERATGLEFGVQLKSSDSASTTSSTRLKTTTLNYLRAQATPTLIVQTNRPSDTISWQWVHNIETPHEDPPATAIVALPNTWDRKTPEHILRDVQGFMRAKELHHHLPVHVLITEQGATHSTPSTLPSTIRQALNRFPELRVRHSSAVSPFINLLLKGDHLTVQLSGRPPRTIQSAARNGSDWSITASDAIGALGLTLHDAGLAPIGIRLLELSCENPHALSSGWIAAEAMAALTENSSTEAATKLIEKSFSAGDDDAPHWILAGFAVAAHRATAEYRSEIANKIRTASETSSDPGLFLYNAASALGGYGNAQDALPLYIQCAEVSNAYLTRDYWWLEKGALHWELAEFTDAEEHYRHASNMGSIEAGFRLGDLYMRTGRYRESLDLFSDLPDDPEPTWAQWRLSRIALRYICDDLKIDRQSRDLVNQAEPDDDIGNSWASALGAVHADALNGWAQWALCPIVRAEGESAFRPCLTAALSLLTCPEVWQEVIVDVMATKDIADATRLQILSDCFACVKRYCEDPFVEMTFHDPHIGTELREILLSGLEAVNGGDPLTIRKHSEDGSFEEIKMHPLK